MNIPVISLSVVVVLLVITVVVLVIYFKKIAPTNDHFLSFHIQDTLQATIPNPQKNWNDIGETDASAANKAADNSAVVKADKKVFYTVFGWPGVSDIKVASESKKGIVTYKVDKKDYKIVFSEEANTDSQASNTVFVQTAAFTSPDENKYIYRNGATLFMRIVKK